MPTTYLAAWLLLAVALGASSCGRSSQTAPAATLFTPVPGETSGIDFVNQLALEGNFDVFRYRNYYNGGGVAIGDVNNDGLPDIYLTANQAPNRLYLNQGNWKFADATTAAGVAGSKAWSTGVAMVDINGDGWLDIYVCNSGDVEGDDKENELFVNQQDGTFKEQAADYGLADSGFSTHAVFFDYDRDGDLDCYVLNNSFRPISTLGLRNLRPIRDQRGGDKLYRNDAGKFVDVSEAAGIYGSVIGFGLGVTVGDVNLDGWPDLYISNDFYERDYLYLNQGDGTFGEALTEQMGHTSHFSMGADMADLNNDVYPEIFVTDMLPDNLARIRQTTAFLGFDEYQVYQRNGLYHQYMRNTLQWNNADDTFSEVAQLAGVQATDWSWCALLADFDNNGFRDIFVSNGVYKDVTDQDFINFLAQDENIRAAQRGEPVDFKRFVEKMPSTPLGNYAFANSGQPPFDNVTQAWGLGDPSFSNGAAYGDLDGDGDLDLVVNNLNSPLGVWENHTADRDHPTHRTLRLRLRDQGANPFVVGARVLVYAGGQTHAYEHLPMRGFQSSMDYQVVMGLGEVAQIDSAVLWSPYGAVKVLGPDTPLDQWVEVDFAQPDRRQPTPPLPARPVPHQWLQADASLWPTATPAHQENPFLDFDRDKLLYHALSTEGPALALGDVDGDGWDDFYLGGAAGQPGQLWRQQNGRFVPTDVPAFVQDAAYEDVDALWFDADGDGDPDLLVVSGGNEYLYQSDQLDDRLYLNESRPGQLRLVRAEQALPRIRRVMSCVVPLDVDGDGDLDLFVGGRIHPQGYGLPTSSYLLENNKGQFTDASARWAPGLRDLGMVTSAVAADFNGDGATDLALAGEWMPITLFYNQGGAFPATAKTTIPGSSGWWSALHAADLDADGRLDLVGGNLGLNTRWWADTLRPMHLYTEDFDRNGAYEQVFCLTENGQEMPIVLKRDLGKVLPAINKKFVSFAAYMPASAPDIFGAEALAGAAHQQINTLRTTVFFQDAGQGWTVADLPWQAQLAPIYAIYITDLDADGRPDLLMGGNLDRVKPEMGRYDASYGICLTNAGNRQFVFVPNRLSGFAAPGQLRKLQAVRTPRGNRLLGARNHATMLSWQCEPCQ